MELSGLLSQIPILGPVLPYIPFLVMAGALIASALPAPGPNASFSRVLVYEIVQWCAINKGWAQNQAKSARPLVPGPTRPIMVTLAVTLLLGLTTTACTQQQSDKFSADINSAFASAPGQLFCAIQTGGGGAIVVGLINGAVTGAAPAAAPIAVLATGASKNYVDNKCAEAAKNVGGTSGIPVSPPAEPTKVPAVAVSPTS